MPYGYSDNGSRRLTTRAQAGLRTYFQPQGKPYSFKLVEVPIPLEAYGYTYSLGTSVPGDPGAAVQPVPVSTTPVTTTPPTTDTTKTSVDLAQYAPLAEAAGALLGTVASTLITKGYETKQLRIAAEAEAASAPQTVVYQTYTKGTGEGLSGTTIALLAGAVVVVGGIVYFATQGGDEEEVEEEGVE